MSHFSAEWLSLREPADARARSVPLTRTVADALAHVGHLRVLDLASGAGANVRYLAPHFKTPQDWLLVDHDQRLLDVARAGIVAPVTTRVVDLAHLDQLDDLLTRRDLVTASALLDLVSEDWLQRLLALCLDARATVLFALSYDGRIECAPEDPDDALVRDLVNRHQRRDKGLGAALGPEAAGRTAAILNELGYDVCRARSDWRLGPESASLQTRLIAGWAEAATEMVPHDADGIFAWRNRRLAHIPRRSSFLLVGHEDVTGVI